MILMMRFVGILCVFLLWDILGYTGISEKRNVIWLSNSWDLWAFAKGRLLWTSCVPCLTYDIEPRCQAFCKQTQCMRPSKTCCCPWYPLFKKNVYWISQRTLQWCMENDLVGKGEGKEAELTCNCFSLLESLVLPRRHLVYYSYG